MIAVSTVSQLIQQESEEYTFCPSYSLHMQEPAVFPFKRRDDPSKFSACGLNMGSKSI